MTRRLLRLEVVPAEPGVAGTAVGRRKTLSWRWRGLLIPFPPLLSRVLGGPGL